MDLHLPLQMALPGRRLASVSVYGIYLCAAIPRGAGAQFHDRAGARQFDQLRLRPRCSLRNRVFGNCGRIKTPSSPIPGLNVTNGS